jgi:hypothetical protein
MANVDERYREILCYIPHCTFSIPFPSTVGAAATVSGIFLRARNPCALCAPHNVGGALHNDR